MTMNQEEQKALIESTEVNVRVAAAQVARRWHAFITYADLAQEGVCWVLQHPGTVTDRLDDGRRGSGRLTGMIAKHLERIARNEKAFGLYDPADEFFYTQGIIETILPAVFDESYMIAPPQSDQDSGYQKQIKDPSEQGNWLAMVIDVRRAWTDAVMDLNWRVAIGYRYGEGLRVYQIAQIMEVADSTAHLYIAKGIKAMIKILGGPSPGDCQPDCECGNGKMGKRHAISNAEAVAITERQYE